MDLMNSYPEIKGEDGRIPHKYPCNSWYRWKQVSKQQKVFSAFSAKTTNTLEIRAMIPDLGNQVVES